MRLARREFSDEPKWPTEGGAAPVVFLLDASSALERRLLEAWIERRRPERPVSADRCLAIPSSRRPGHGGLGKEFDVALASEEDPLLAPLRVVWLPAERDGVRAVRLSDLLTFGDPRDPRPLRQRYLVRRFPDRCRIVAGKPARVSELRTRWSRAGGSAGGATSSLSEFVTRQAHLALERAERRLRGARYKVPRLLAEEILGNPSVRSRLVDIAAELGRSEASVEQEAAADLREIAATHSPFVIDIVAQLIRLLYTQGYGHELQYDREELASIAALSQRHPVVFLPTHKSNLDHLVLQYALHENGLPPNHTAGGINMNFFPLGPLIRRSGIFFIRRSFRDDPIYKHVLRSYVDYLIEKRFSLEWYIEGGRSRSGKLLPPRFGMLAYVVDAFRRGKSDDVHLIPVSIAYDQIQDVASYTKEQRGGDKEKEGLAWMIRAIRDLRRPYGRIHIRFGDPLSLRRQLGDPEPLRDAEPDERELALQKVAFEVSFRINRATPITPVSLLTLALLGAGDRAVTLEQVAKGLVNLLRYVEKRKLAVTADLFRLKTDDGIEQTLDALIENDVVTRFDDGPEPVYHIGAEQQLTAAYYRNTIVHFFVNSAIAELSILHVAGAARRRADPVGEFWAEAMRLRDLFKFEFFFADKETYREQLRAELAFQDAHWEEKLAAGPESAGDLVRSFRPFSAHRVLRPFIESYQVVSDNLQRHAANTPLDEKAFIASCLGLGEQYRLQHRIQSSASISKVLFETALELARNRGLLSREGEPPADAATLTARRREFAQQIRDVHRRIEAVVALGASRRAGLIP